MERNVGSNPPDVSFHFTDWIVAFSSPVGLRGSEGSGVVCISSYLNPELVRPLRQVTVIKGFENKPGLFSTLDWTNVKAFNPFCRLGRTEHRLIEYYADVINGVQSYSSTQSPAFNRCIGSRWTRDLTFILSK